MGRWATGARVMPDGELAERGFSPLVRVRRGPTTTTLLFDTGLSPDAMVTNADRLGLDLSGIQAVVLSHGHFDHAGGLAPRCKRSPVWHQDRQRPLNATDPAGPAGGRW